MLLFVVPKTACSFLYLHYHEIIIAAKICTSHSYTPFVLNEIYFNTSLWMCDITNSHNFDKESLAVVCFTLFIGNLHRIAIAMHSSKCLCSFLSERFHVYLCLKHFGTSWSLDFSCGTFVLILCKKNSWHSNSFRIGNVLILNNLSKNLKSLIDNYTLRPKWLKRLEEVSFKRKTQTQAARVIGEKVCEFSEKRSGRQRNKSRRNA